ncbi:MAG: hypothetical protein WCD31_01740, partial [Gillisia sp.]
MRGYVTYKLLGLILFLLFSCKKDSSTETPTKMVWKPLNVQISAYNSTKYQTGEGNPNVTAWGDTLKPGERAIAISPDLLKKGLKHNTPVRIEGLSGIYFVKDKMNDRWRNKI